MMGRVSYGIDLATIHAAGFTGLAVAAGAELLGRLEPESRVLELGAGDGTTAEMLVAAGHLVHGIDLSPAFVDLARERVPGASFAVGSFIDASLPTDRDAILAAGEVFGYASDPRADRDSLDAVFSRCRGALRDGGLLLFDLAAPSRGDTPARHWTQGDGWACLVERSVSGNTLTREIITFREVEPGRFRRSEEHHELSLHEPGDVLECLNRSGFDAKVLDGYGAFQLPGLKVYAATARAR